MTYLGRCEPRSPPFLRASGFAARADGVVVKVRVAGIELRTSVDDFVSVPGRAAQRGGMVGGWHAMQWRALMAALHSSALPCSDAEVRRKYFLCNQNDT